MAPGLRDVLLGGGITLAGGLAGVFVTDVLQRRREKRRDEKNKRLLAEALAAELDLAAGRLKEALRLYDECKVDSPTTKCLFSSAAVASEQWSTVFDGNSAQIYLLPQEVAASVTRCYQALGGDLSQIRMLRQDLVDSADLSLNKNVHTNNSATSAYIAVIGRSPKDIELATAAIKDLAVVAAGSYKTPKPQR